MGSLRKDRVAKPMVCIQEVHGLPVRKWNWLLFLFQLAYLPWYSIDMQFHHILSTRVIYWVPCLVFRVDYPLKENDK